MAIIVGSKKESMERVAKSEQEWQKAKDRGVMINPSELDTVDFNALLDRLNSGRGQYIPELNTEDLLKIKREANKLGKKYTGGIKARQVINKSLSVDRQRSNSDIKWAMCSGYNNNVFRFVTDASGRNRASKHYVNVEFVDFHRYLSMPNENKAVDNILHGYVKFDCDCGRHTYYFRYIATAGGFAYVGNEGKQTLGRAETAFPKIRNPNLKGIACKHSLKVMQAILSDGRVRKIMADAVHKRRANDKDRSGRITEKEAKAIKQQMKDNPISVLSTGEKFIPKNMINSLRQQMRSMSHSNTTENHLNELRKKGNLSESLFDKIGNRFNRFRNK